MEGTTADDTTVHDATDRDTVADWLGLVDARWPWATAQSWDHVGLQVGDPADVVARVLVSLDVTLEVVEEAADQPGTLVLAHHPLLFRPLDALTPATASGRSALAAARAGVAVAAAHTNLDIASDGTGTSDPVVRALDLVDVEPLSTQPGTDQVKLVTFVPPEHLDAVVDAVTATGAGTIGDYSRCTFRSRGTGTYRPLEGASPHVGSHGADHAVDEWRLEVVVARAGMARAVAALESVHPHEEVAVDLVPLVVSPQPSIGRIGRLREPASLTSVAQRLRDGLPSPHLRAAGDPDRLVEVVATVGGAGDSMVGDAVAAGAECYVTGDLRHHVTLDAVADGLAVVDAGHHAVEHAAMAPWIRALEQERRRLGLAAPVVASTVDTQPWLQL